MTNPSKDAIKRVAMPMVEREEDWQNTLEAVKDHFNMECTEENRELIMDARETRFRVIGEDRATGAIGISEPFTITVAANNFEFAEQSARSQRYASGREHVHIVAVECS